MTTTATASQQPVTVIVSRRVRAGQERAFEAALTGMIADALRFEGHLGVNVVRPEDSTSGSSEYTVIFKFASPDALAAWEASDIRREWLARLAPLADGAPTERHLSGLETWFTLPHHPTVVPPPRWKMLLVTWIAAYPIITLLLGVFGSTLGHLPLLLRTLTMSGLLLTLMTYVVMPRMTILFRRWLYPHDSQNQKK